MVEKLAERVFSFTKKFASTPSVEHSIYSSAEIIDAIQSAKKDWITARAYFETATDPDLVDYSIFAIEAAEKKYMYLLKQAKAMGVASNEMYYYE